MLNAGAAELEESAGELAALLGRLAVLDGEEEELLGVCDGLDVIGVELLMLLLLPLSLVQAVNIKATTKMTANIFKAFITVLQ